MLPFEDINTCNKNLTSVTIKTIKIIIPYIAEQLADIFSKSIVSGVFPDSLKHAKITPIFKLVNNYRPISVLPVFSSF